MYEASVFCFVLFCFSQLPSLLFASFFNMQVKVVSEENQNATHEIQIKGHACWRKLRGNVSMFIRVKSLNSTSCFTLPLK